ncbi:hypothetical protein ACF3MZ_07355 [Paenibacillaceae bacterium WGS1546]|uniref:hypothetical protein n=1 Tax=Cohnella sp. WGS1546 TaxID=3366810 RepID=UPI00372D560D
MNLAEMLCYADIADLTRIADAYGCDCSSHSKNELIQSILATVQRRDVVESTIGEISGDDLRFLNSLLFESRTAYSLEELKARAASGEAGKSAAGSSAVAETASGAGKAEKPKPRSKKAAAALRSQPAEPVDSARAAIMKFKKYGWLFNGFSQQTRMMFQVPEDVKTRLREALEKRYRASLVSSDEPMVYRDERSLFSEDVAHFLRFVRDHEPPLTAEGVMYKRHIGQALELMSVRETAPSRGGWRFGYGRHFRDYPDRFSLVYDFAYFEGYVAEVPDRLVLTAEGRDAADRFAKPEPLRPYRFWLRLYRGPIPNLAALVQWIVRLSADWVTVDSLFGILQPLVRPYYYDTPRDVLERRILTMLVHLGVLRWGQTPEGSQVVKTTPQGPTLAAGQALELDEPIDIG